MQFGVKVHVSNQRSQFSVSQSRHKIHRAELLKLMSQCQYGGLPAPVPPMFQPVNQNATSPDLEFCSTIGFRLVSCSWCCPSADFDASARNGSNDVRDSAPRGEYAEHSALLINLSKIDFEGLLEQFKWIQTRPRKWRSRVRPRDLGLRRA
jgi:hypothetical protein